ncbi:hypothetical protein GCM10018789_37510 [Streptomyces werraensis]|nr:hypothetical protein GCM10018789_37510 [Streptomyces werraensis]
MPFPTDPAAETHRCGLRRAASAVVRCHRHGVRLLRVFARAVAARCGPGCAVALAVGHGTAPGGAVGRHRAWVPGAGDRESAGAPSGGEDGPDDTACALRGTEDGPDK